MLSLLLLLLLEMWDGLIEAKRLFVVVLPLLLLLIMCVLLQP